MLNRDGSATHALVWMREGWDRLHREPARWFGMTLMFFVIALVLKNIPFLGNFVLVLISPIILAGALLAARSNNMRTAPQNAKQWFQALTLDGLRELFQVFRREDHAFAIVIVCIVTLGLVVLVNIPELLITGGSVISGLSGVSLAGPIRPSTIVGVVVVIVLYALLAMGLLYVVPLTLFGNRQPVPAVVESFRSCLVQRAALLWFVAPFIAINFAIMIAFSLGTWFGYLMLFSLGIVTLPTFVVGLNASYRALFERPAGTPSPSATTVAP
ncbi:MAG TPA: hypothetical protein VJS66_02715 [Burkholderiales bacterium]|nr:hypothetical protein [Burkholderiales bacterium]